MLIVNWFLFDFDENCATFIAFEKKILKDLNMNTYLVLTVLFAAVYSTTAYTMQSGPSTHKGIRMKWKNENKEPFNSLEKKLCRFSQSVLCNR